MELCLKMIRKPVVDTARFERVLERHIYALKDAYTMSD
jgi:acyl-CoA dehydrogenase